MVTLALPFGVAQFVLSTLLHVAVGNVGALITMAEQVAVHPVVVLVTVTVYVALLNPVIVAVVPPLLHKYVTPVAVATAVPFGVTQLVLFVFEQVTVGGDAVLPTIA